MQEHWFWLDGEQRASPTWLALTLCFAGYTEGICFKEKKFINREDFCSKRDIYSFPNIVLLGQVCVNVRPYFISACSIWLWAKEETVWSSRRSREESMWPRSGDWNWLNLSLMLFGLCVCLIIAHRNCLWKEPLLSFKQIPLIHFLIKKARKQTQWNKL